MVVGMCSLGHADLHLRRGFRRRKERRWRRARCGLNIGHRRRPSIVFAKIGVGRMERLCLTRGGINYIGRAVVADEGLPWRRQGQRWRREQVEVGGVG